MTLLITKNIITKSKNNKILFKSLFLKMLLEILHKNKFTLDRIESSHVDEEEDPDSVFIFDEPDKVFTWSGSLKNEWAIDFIWEWDGEVYLYFLSPNKNKMYIRLTLWNEPYECWSDNNILHDYDDPPTEDDILLDKVSDQVHYAIETVWEYIS